MYNINRTNVNGGGVAVFVRNCFAVKTLSSSSGELDRPEYILLEILINTTKILFAGVYRRPKAGYFNFLLDDIYKYTVNYKYFFLCGDINAGFGRGGEDTRMVTEFINLCNLECVPFKSTYHTATCDSNLDVIASNCTEHLIRFGQTPASGFSAHDLIYAVFNLSVPRPTNLTFSYRNLNAINVENLISDVEHAPWSDMYYESDIEIKLDCFNSIILGLLDKHAPIQTKKFKQPSAPWMTDDIRKMLCYRNKLRKKCIRTRDQSDMDNFRSIRNKVKQCIRNAKVKYYYSKFNTTNMRQTWATIRSLNLAKSASQNAKPVIPVNDLNLHYASVSTVKNPELISQTVRKYYSIHGSLEVSDKFFFKYVLFEDIWKAVHSIKSKATGFDGVPISFLRLCLPALLPVLDHIFNFSLQNGLFPSMWKLANIIPIPKIKNPVECKDYRPVSILCVLGKILEKIVHAQVCEYLVQKNLFTPCQSGFRPKHSSQRYITMFNAAPVPPLVIKGCVIPLSETVNNLGVTFDCTLSWFQHCMLISKKILATLAQVRRSCSFIPPNVRKLIVSALVMPHLDYASVLFTDISDTNHQRLQRLQNAAVRFICGSSRFDHITPFYTSLNILNLEKRRIVAVAVLIRKIIKYRSPVYLYILLRLSNKSGASVRATTAPPMSPRAVMIAAE
ncbi:LINE-1 retrotransposable element ORF2 protein, partial [Frankliniella fusca]